MKYSIAILIILSFIGPNSILSQDFTEGFSYLNNGEYDEAEIFFTKAMHEFPNNKTAQICYGRAIGLNGNPSGAKQTFIKLVDANPTDKESLLNLAESYLWNKEIKDAISLYESLKSQYPNEELILRSLANAYALDSKYQIAFDYATDCITLDSENDTSKETYRTIGLAYAHHLKGDKQYSESTIILERLEELYPVDKDIITSKAYTLLAQKKYENAEVEFNKLHELDLDPVQSLLGLSSVFLQTSNHKKSLSLLSNDLLLDDNLSQAQKLQKWDILFGTYLSTNPSKAKEVLVKLKPHITVSQFAEKHVYLQLEFEEYDGIQNYVDHIQDKTVKQNIDLRIALESNNFDVFNSLLEKVDYQIADRYTESLIQNIKTKQAHKFTSRIELAKDNGNNLAKEIDLYFVSAEAKTFSPFVQLRSRWLTNMRQSPNTSNHTILNLGSHINLKNNRIIKLGIGVESITNKEDKKTFIPNYDVSYHNQFNRRHFVKLFSFKKQLNYNQDLFSQNINKYNFGIEHHITNRSGLGSYTQINLIILTDQNIGHDLFNSLYINISNNPIIQTGLNSTFLSYSENKIEYFSPKSLLSISPFLKLSNEYSPDKKLKYSILGSIGKQIDLGNSESTQLVYSIQIKSGYHLSQHLYTELFYTYANNSSVVNNGFSSYYLGINLKYSL